MKKIILVETSSNSELELRVIENAIDRAIKECERDADDYVETSVFVDNEAIERIISKLERCNAEFKD